MGNANPLVDASPQSAEAGTIGRTAAWAIAVALIATVLLVAVTLEILRRYQFAEGSSVGSTLLYQVPAILLGLWILKRSQTKREVSFSVRALAWIPLLHIALLAGVHSIWSRLSIDEERWWRLEWGESVPVDAIVVVTAGLLFLFVVGSAIFGERRRAQRWILTFTVFAATFLLSLGLWLPIACTTSEAYEPWHWVLQAKIMSPHFPWLVLIPPTLAAAAVAALVLAESYVLQIGRNIVWGGLLGASWLAVLFRATANDDQALAYSNFIPVLLCVAAICLLCIATLAAMQWLTLRQVRRLTRRSASSLLEGTIISSPGNRPPARILCLGWLAGLRTESSSFVVQTSDGNVQVPSRAQLIFPLPLWTTNASKGSSMPILNIGDRVILGGFVSPEGDQPFRTSTAPVPGTKGIVVMKRQEEPWRTWREVALATWRPTLLYLIAAGITAVAGLAGFFAL